MSEPQSSFFDRKTIIAIALMMVFWIGWQKYMMEKYPAAQKPATPAGQAAAPPASSPKMAAPATKRDEVAEANSNEPETTLVVENANLSFQISSRGMGLKDIQLKGFTDREGQPIRLGAEAAGHLSLETRLMGRASPLLFAIEKQPDGRFVGHAQAEGLEVTKSMTVDKTNYVLDTEVKITGDLQALVGVETYLMDPLLTPKGGGFLSPATESQEIYIEGIDHTERLKITHDKEQSVTVERAQVVALASHYFTQAIADHSDVSPQVQAGSLISDDAIMGVLRHQVLNKGREFLLHYRVFLGPKDVSLLKSVDAQLAGVVNFGFFSILGRPILQMLRWFHGLVGNWGIAIILLTLLVRFLVLPFNAMSFRSAKAMQAIQPQIQALREKFKEDPTRLNQETLQLFRTYKVNPLGGCLPVLLQIPIFFALYQVLGQSVELYQAPFMLWIHDLSFKDPYFVLPVLMGITMFIQQRLTPTAMDPAQAKVLMFMPVIFSVFMLALPSGLTLYIFVSTLFGIAQQMFLMKTYTPVIPTNK